jgi:NDP-sugar pyrophosphorylase family protein
MEAMIFAAGLGTRLKPLTDCKPKALIEIGDKTLLEINIMKLIDFGCKHIVINVHHFAEQIKQHIKTKNYPAEILISDETSQLLDTGGGLLKAKNLFSLSQDIILHNVDIISDVKFELLAKTYHSLPNTIATLAISKRQTSRQILFNEKMQLGGWQNNLTDEKIITRNNENFQPYGFSGIQILSPSIFAMLNGSGSFPIIPQYLEISKEHIINGFVHSEARWLDVGKLSVLPEAVKLLSALSK